MLPVVTPHGIRVDYNLPYSPTKDWTRKARLIAAIAILIFNIGDLLLTYKVISMGGLEGNPLAVWLVETKWIIPLKLAICASIIVGALHHSRKKVFNPDKLWLLCALWLTAGVYFCVIIVNTLTLIKYLGAN